MAGRNVTAIWEHTTTLRGACRTACARRIRTGCDWLVSHSPLANAILPRSRVTGATAASAGIDCTHLSRRKPCCTMSKLLVLAACGVEAMRPSAGKAPKCSRRQSFAAAAATLLVPTAATAATAEQVERAAKQGILKCFEKRDDKLVNDLQARGDRGAQGERRRAAAPGVGRGARGHGRLASGEGEGGGEAGQHQAPRDARVAQRREVRARPASPRASGCPGPSVAARRKKKRRRRRKRAKKSSARRPRRRRGRPLLRPSRRRVEVTDENARACFLWEREDGRDSSSGPSNITPISIFLAQQHAPRRRRRRVVANQFQAPRRAQYSGFVEGPSDDLDADGQTHAPSGRTSRRGQRSTRRPGSRWRVVASSKAPRRRNVVVS